MLRRRLVSLNLMNRPLWASHFSCAASSPLLAFTELKRVRVLLWIKLWLKERLKWSSLQTTKTFSIWATRLFHFLTIFMFPGVALLMAFNNFFLCIHNLAATRGRAAYLIFQQAFLTKLNQLPVFDLKWEITRLFLSLEQTIIRLLIGMISILLYLRD